MVVVVVVVAVEEVESSMDEKQLLIDLFVQVHDKNLRSLYDVA